MKKLRVLTGRHAGSDLPLEAPVLTVSADPEHDAQITDWSEPPITLQIHEHPSDAEVVSIRMGSEGPMMVLPDFTPLAFGAVVLCVGPAAVEWPSDIELLRRLLSPRTEADQAADEAPSLPADHRLVSRRRAQFIGAGLAAAAVLLGGFTWLLRESPPATPAPTPLAVAWKLVEATGHRDVSVRPDGGQVVVEGLLPDTTALQQLRRALSVLPPGVLQDRLASATEISQTIVDTLRVEGLAVQYLDRGEFLVQGAAVDAARLNAQAERLTNELKPLVRRIVLSVKDLPPTPRMPTGAVMRADGVEYVQTRDGTKHIALITTRGDPPTLASPPDSSSTLPSPTQH